MPRIPRPPLTPDERAGMKRWLENWSTAGPVLERERGDRLRNMKPEKAQVATRRVWELWRPDWAGDDGKGLILQQRIFRRARVRLDPPLR